MNTDYHWQTVAFFKATVTFPFQFTLIRSFGCPSTARGPILISADNKERKEEKTNKQTNKQPRHFNSWLMIFLENCILFSFSRKIFLLEKPGNSSACYQQSII
jgi:hypothetical protein